MEAFLLVMRQVYLDRTIDGCCALQKLRGLAIRKNDGAKEDRTDTREIGDVKRITLLSFIFACAVSSFANDSKVLIGGIDVPVPAGYVRISKGHPIDALLAKSESPDSQNEVLAHYVRSAALQPDGTLCEGEDVLNGLLTLKVPRIKVKIDSVDFERLSNAVAAGVQRGLRASKEGDRAIGVLGARRFEDGSLSVGNARVESDDKRIERTKVTTSVISCHAGHMFTVVRTATAKDRDGIKSIHASSERVIEEWISSIRLAAGRPCPEVRQASYAVPVGDMRSPGRMSPTQRSVGWQGFLKGGALIGAFALLLIVAARNSRAKKESADGSVAKKDVEGDRSVVTNGSSAKSEGDAPVKNADGSVRFSKIPPGGAMEMLRVAYEKTRAPQQPVQDGQLAFLNAGENGIMRLVFQEKQGKVVADHVKCRLYLPDGWNLVPELEAQSAANVIVKFAGPGEHEWMSVEHLFLSPDHVNDNLGDWVDIGMKLFGKAILHPAAGKAEGVDGGKYLLFGKLGQRDIHYMKYHQADDMVAYAGTIEIEEKPFRLFIVVLRRGRDSWKFEYVFPAADGVSREALSFRSEEIASAARMFVPIETRGRAVCPLCGAGMDDPPEGKLIDGLTVEMKDFTLFEGGPKVGHAGMTLACCDECKCKLPVSGIDRMVLEGVPDVKAQLDKGASIVEVKCGDRPVTIREACEEPQKDIANVIEEAKRWMELKKKCGEMRKEHECLSEIRRGILAIDDSECPEDVAPLSPIDESMRRHMTESYDCHVDCKEAKPVVYLYPETRTKCNVKVVLDGVLTCTYPDHGTNGWQNFIAAPDGTLTFPDGRKYYCLFWEGRTNSEWGFSRGYCVKGSETASFLADVLAKMGLSFREANEFIIYWLPRMQNNPYNVIAFQGETYTKDAKLEIEPKPDSVLRIFMAWRAIDRPVSIPEPDIKPFKRKGFTVVEWGGTELND